VFTPFSTSVRKSAALDLVLISLNFHLSVPLVTSVKAFGNLQIRLQTLPKLPFDKPKQMHLKLSAQSSTRLPLFPDFHSILVMDQFSCDQGIDMSKNFKALKE
jgi:hypothetical protein